MAAIDTLNGRRRLPNHQADDNDKQQNACHCKESVCDAADGAPMRVPAPT